MTRLETENHNTPEYYNKALIKHFLEAGIEDKIDAFRIDWLLKDFKGGKLLDLGCGISTLPVKASKVKNSEVYALDFADVFIPLIDAVIYSVTSHKVKHIVGNVENTPFENNFFDYIVMGELLEHCEDPFKVINEAKRILKDDGLIAISTPDNETPEEHTEKNHIWGITEEDIRKMVNVKQLDIVGKKILCIGSK